MAIHRSTNEKFQIVQEYYNNGLNVRQFSKSIGIAPSTLHDWLRKVEDNLEQDTSTSLVNNNTHVKRVVFRLPYKGLLIQ